MMIRAWDDARREFFDSNLPGVCGFKVEDGIISAYASYEQHPYACQVQVAHPSITVNGSPIFEGDTVTVVTYRRRDHLNRNSYTSNNDRLELSGIVVKDYEGRWKVYLESEIEEKIAVLHSTPLPKMPHKEWYVIETKFRQYAALTMENLEHHASAYDLDALWEHQENVTQ